MANQSENSSNPIIDVEAEDVRRQYIKGLFDRNYIYIADHYYVQLKKLNLLDHIVQMIEEENKTKPLVSNLLKNHSIFIPEKFYQPMVNKNLFWRIIRALRLADIKRQLEELDNLPIGESDDDDDDKDTTTDSKKRKRSEEEEDVDEIVNKIFHSSD